MRLKAVATFAVKLNEDGQHHWYVETDGDPLTWEPGQPLSLQAERFPCGTFLIVMEPHDPEFHAERRTAIRTQLQAMGFAIHPADTADSEHD